MNTFNFFKPQQTQQLWQTISLHWSHHNRPFGQRFLGSIQISQKATDQVLDVVGYNLRDISRITYNKLHEKFDEPEQNWLKILTFALSEYAYYYSSVEDKFWDGFCQKLKLTYNPSIENTLRKIVGEGFNILGIVKAKGGYSYVSTLWLQSGIPNQNIQHFAQLVQEFSNEYGWWEIAHNSCEDIAEELLIFCQEKHPQWGTLINFLKASCSQQEEKEVEPISGQLLQGIAIIAVELERQGTLPEELKSDNEREKILENYYLPNNFFLRNWNSLIEVLTPKQRRYGSKRRIISRRQKPLSLILDVADSLNMQLVLPEQNLWKKGWENLGGTFCQIPEATWEGTIPSKPELMIPEQVVDIRNIVELSMWQLLDHNRKCLMEWKVEGIDSDFSCVVFDAWTGDRLNLNSTNLTIRGRQEIIFFTPKGIHLNFSHGIEILDSCVPSSMRDWRGQHLILTTKEASISFSSKNTYNTLISWIHSVEEQPILKGLKLKGKKSIYVEIPTLWYPPIKEEIFFNVSIENITQQQIIINTTEKIPLSSSWQPISLNKWITKSGKYEVRFWNQLNRWSYKFEIQDEYQINEKPDMRNLLISSSSQVELKTSPILTNSNTKFWSEEIKIEGLFPLEIISLSLQDQHETLFSQCQADSLGNLSLNLASWYNSLSSNSDWYGLDYQRLGGELEPLIKMQISPLSISWNWENQAVKISGLFPHENYFLSCWNLLLPEKPPLEIQIPILSNKEIITIPLELGHGIYHIQLFCSRKLFRNLGWWCVSNQNDLPEEALENEDLENYCYTILGNEPVNDFIKATNKFDYDSYLLKTTIDSLKNLPCYFPEWLDINSFTDKLQTLLENLKVNLKISPNRQQSTISKIGNNNDLETTQNKWLLIKLKTHKKRDIVSKQIEKMMQINNPKLKILILHVPKIDVYKDILLLEYQQVSNINTHNILSEYIQENRHLKYNEAQKILGY